MNMVTPTNLLTSCEGTLTEMQARLAKTRKVGAWVGGTIAVIGIAWTAWAIFSKPKDEPSPPPAPPNVKLP